LRFLLSYSDVTEQAVLVCKWHLSSFDLLIGDIKAWGPRSILMGLPKAQ
jgi:nitrite reductase/ring-hydroxylating ferredoxin subunit